MKRQIRVYGYETEDADGKPDWWITCDYRRAVVINRMLAERGDGPLMRLILVADDKRAEAAMADFLCEKPKRARGRQNAAELLAARAELRRLRAIEAAARAYCDLTPERADETPAPLLFAKLQAALAAKDAP